MCPQINTFGWTNFPHIFFETEFVMCAPNTTVRNLRSTSNFRNKRRKPLAFQEMEEYNGGMFVYLQPKLTGAKKRKCVVFSPFPRQTFTGWWPPDFAPVFNV